ncbi:MAG: hypothetical protein ABIO67_02095 [Mycobacteriales bacterium]
MLSKLLTIAAQNAKLALAGVAGAALVAGGSAVAISNVSDNTEATTADTSVAQPLAAPNSTSVETVTTSPSDTGTVTASPRNHGACVSAVARTKVEGETGREHGKRVSEAAKTCLKGDDSDKAARKDAKTQQKVDRKAKHDQVKADRKSAKAARSAAGQGSDD